jgi:hypothetical protein
MATATGTTVKESNLEILIVLAVDSGSPDDHLIFSLSNPSSLFQNNIEYLV